MNVLEGALVDEDELFICACPACRCLSPVDRPDGSCEDCRRGSHVEHDEGGSD